MSPVLWSHGSGCGRIKSRLKTPAPASLLLVDLQGVLQGAVLNAVCVEVHLASVGGVAPRPRHCWSTASKRLQQAVFPARRL